IRSARAASSRPLEVVVVDNSLDPREAEALRKHADVLIASASNRGYAGGINDGRRACSGEILIVSNPDVVYHDQAIDRLAEALQGDVAVAGPALFWDEKLTWRLPPADLYTGLEKLDEVLASRSRAWFEQRDQRRIRARIAFWSLEKTTPVRALSGAVLAIRAADFDRLHGFDERFALYFEENDFLRRVAAMRRKIVYVPAARCRHLYNQSAGQEAEQAAARFAQSELKYLEKWNGPFAARFLKRIERPLPACTAPHSAARPEQVVVEASPLASFSTAAGSFTATSIPEDVWSSYKGPVLHLRTVDRATGRVVATDARYRT
ncbi:MAG TPA: glycosyltransferase, partial [Thermoanaerobaculia bacterium]